MNLEGSAKHVVKYGDMIIPDPHQSRQGFTEKERRTAVFWSRVEITSPFSCWEWQSNRLPTGYGTYYFKGKNRRAHRVSYELMNGKIPKGQHILHHCDNPPCVNPRHLWSGTTLDNMQDAAQKGRMGKTSQPGEEHPNSKLTESQVLEIRDLFARGIYNQGMLGKLFGVSQMQISNIVLRKHWRHI